MTVVIEDQVKTIAEEIKEQFYLVILKSVDADGQSRDRDIEDVVRAVIAQYDISSIARLGTFDDGLRLEPPQFLSDEDRERDAWDTGGS